MKGQAVTACAVTSDAFLYRYCSFDFESFVGSLLALFPQFPPKHGCVWVTSGCLLRGNEREDGKEISTASVVR